MPSPEFDDLLDRAASVKPLTINVIDALFDKYEDQRAEAARSSRRAAQTVVREPDAEQPVTEVDLEKLSDAEIAKLRTGALLERGRRIREFDRSIAS